MRDPVASLGHARSVRRRVAAGYDGLGAQRLNLPRGLDPVGGIDSLECRVDEIRILECGNLPFPDIQIDD